MSIRKWQIIKRNIWQMWKLDRMLSAQHNYYQRARSHKKMFLLISYDHIISYPLFYTQIILYSYIRLLCYGFRSFTVRSFLIPSLNKMFLVVYIYIWFYYFEKFCQSLISISISDCLSFLCTAAAGIFTTKTAFGSKFLSMPRGLYCIWCTRETKY